MTYFVYVDDSGDENRTLFSALAIPSQHWTKCLDNWLGWRKKTLLRTYGLPASYELHGLQWLKRHPAIDPALQLRQLVDRAGKPLFDPHGVPITLLSEDRFARRERSIQFEKALTIISGFPGAFLLTVHWEGDDDKIHLYEQLLFDIIHLYEQLLFDIENRLTIENTDGIIFLDGLIPGPHYRRRHRDLPIKTRRVLEDPIPMGSDGSQFVQMADLCVHAAFRSMRAKDGDRSSQTFERLTKIADPIHTVARKNISPDLSDEAYLRTRPVGTSKGVRPVAIPYHTQARLRGPKTRNGLLPNTKK